MDPAGRSSGLWFFSLEGRVCPGKCSLLAFIPRDPCLNFWVNVPGQIKTAAGALPSVSCAPRNGSVVVRGEVLFRGDAPAPTNSQLIRTLITEASKASSTFGWQLEPRSVQSAGKCCRASPAGLQLQVPLARPKPARFGFEAFPSPDIPCPELCKTIGRMLRVVGAHLRQQDLCGSVLLLRPSLCAPSLLCWEMAHPFPHSKEFLLTPLPCWFLLLLWGRGWGTNLPSEVEGQV